MATSREGLGIPDEQVWRVRSLNVGTAVDLFVERAGSVAQGFSADEAEVISEICRRLDGIPLAVELAASRMASMTAIEVRDRLDHRFRLLVGARRGLERHQTLRHAVQWSYDLLDEPERTLLERCSVFAGGFDLESARAISGSDDDFTTLDLLDALVRKSLITADRSSGHTRYSMLETIRQFAEEQLALRGDAEAARTAHSDYFAGKAVHTFSMWDSPRQREAYDWFAVELPNLRTAFRWATAQNDVDNAITIATQSGWFGALVENYEPVTWAEELVEPARDIGDQRFVSVCAIASLCYMFGRADDAVAYSNAGVFALRHCSDAESVGPEQLWLGAVYSAINEFDRYIAFFRDQASAGKQHRELSRGCLVIALAAAERTEEALSVAEGLIEAAEATNNPYKISFALLSSGMARSATDPAGALGALKKGLDDRSGHRQSDQRLIPGNGAGNDIESDRGCTR